MELNDKISELKIQFHLAKKQNVQIEKKVNNLRSKLNTLAEEIGNLNTENDVFASQISEISAEISQLKYRNAVIDVCKESEISKREVQLTYIDEHKRGYDVQFDKEEAETAIQKERQKKEEEEEKEIEQQKRANLLEKNERQANDAAVIEYQCDAIERECSILKKRNKAIICRLRRQLVATEKKRRQLIKDL